MTADELEQERADLLAAIDAGEPLTAEIRDRIAAVAEADLATPPSPFEEALAEVLAETVALSDRTLPPGLAIRSDGGTIEVLSRGDVVATVSGSALAERAAQIAARRAIAARRD
jgi:hypothetical protein